MSVNKIFLVSPTESVITQRGKRHPNLAKFLANKNIDLEYITSTINHAEKRIFTEKEIVFGKNRINYNITFLDAGLYKMNISFRRLIWNIKFALSVYKNLKRNCKENDVIILPSRPSELLYIGRLIKRKRNVKLFIDIEDIWPDAFLINNKLIKSGFYLYCNILNKLSIPYFESGVHVSPNFSQWLNRYKPGFTSVFTPLGINHGELKPEYIAIYNKEPEQINLFYGGTLTLQFDILPVLEAVLLSKRNFKITLAGDGGTGERFKSIINFLNENNINFINHGILAKDDFLYNLGKADVAIIPMISGGLPKKFYDAIGCFKPILCLGKGGVYEEVFKFDLGWVSSFDKHKISNVLSQINQSSLKSKIENIKLSQERYLEKNSIEIIYRELQKIYLCNN